VKVSQWRRTSTGKLVLILAVTTLAFGCAPSIAQRGPAPASAAPQQPDRTGLIDHLTPARDSMGRAPTHFSWTPIQGAEAYSIGVWNEVDQMVWRQDHIPTASVERPAEIVLEPGTYFWSISALRDDEQIGDSGLAAFVVRTVP
jgi:hypothetical protein